MDNSENVILGRSFTKVGPWNAIVFHQVTQAYLNQLESDNQALLEEESQIHTDECNWWHDWHECSCGAFDIENKEK